MDEFKDKPGDESKDLVLFPGAERPRRKKSGHGNNRQFRGLPKLKGNASGYDRERIHREYMESPIVDWRAYCESRRYNPEPEGLGWRSWQREKKYKTAWGAATQEIEEAGTSLGPAVLLRALRAVKDAPEALSSLLTLCRYAVQIHIDEIREEEEIRKKARLEGKNVPRGTTGKFTAESQDVLFLANATVRAQEALYKALGIDMSLGINPERWMEMVESQLSRIDGSNAAEQDSEVMNVSIIGATNARQAMKEAFDEYIDKPQAVPEVIQPEPPEGEEPPENEVVDVGDPD